MQMQFLTWQLTIQRVYPTTSELATTYDQVAHLWDTKIRRLGYDRAYRTLMADLYPTLFANPLAPIGAATTTERVPVLDCGVGTGALSLALQQNAPLPLQIHAVDLSPKMLVAAEERLTALGVAIQTKRHDIRSLPYVDQSFDLVMSAHTLEHLPDTKSALYEMARVLKPGGTLLLITTRRGFLGSVLDAYWGLNFLQPNKLCRWLTACGLTNVTCFPMPGPIWCRWLSYGCLAYKM